MLSWAANWPASYSKYMLEAQPKAGQQRGLKKLKGELWLKHLEEHWIPEESSSEYSGGEGEEPMTRRCQSWISEKLLLKRVARCDPILDSHVSGLYSLIVRGKIHGLPSCYGP